MPWSPSDAPEHDKAANTPALRMLWSRVANRILQETHNDRRALSGAAAVVKRKKGGA